MTKATKIYALLGRAVDYSYSPLIHNYAFRELGLPCHYTVFNIADPDLVQEALRGARALGIAGFNVTIPYKKTVVPFLDDHLPLVFLLLFGALGVVRFAGTAPICPRSSSVSQIWRS